MTTAPRQQAPDGDAYKRRREQVNQIQTEQRRSGRDIAPLPAVVNPERRAECRPSLRLFCETYLGETFCKPWSKHHLSAISRLEIVITTGGRIARAMPRGDGKTSLMEAATLWAVLYGHRRFPFVVGATKDKADQILESIQVELEHNDLLLADFPEVCYPIRKLEGIAQRANGQLLDGERTMMSWSAGQIVLPTIAGSSASGAVIRVAGITGGIRGAKAKLPDGRSIRPDLVLIDDPQTEESAASPTQVEKRESTIRKAILGLAGPGEKIAAMAAVTVVEEDDLADRLLDRERNPEWHGERTGMLEMFPKRMELWEKYRGLQLEDLDRGDDQTPTACAFYLENREAMDEGASASWEARYESHQASAIEHAMSLYLADPVAFWSEYQNEPKSRTSGSVRVTPQLVAERIGSLGRWTVPNEAVYLTAAIDVQKPVLYYLVNAWTICGTCWVLAYGAEPEQGRAYWTLRDAKKTLMGVHGGTFEAALERGLGSLAERLMGREYVREDGTSARIERCMVDANWGESTDTVYRWLRRSPLGSVMMPCHGRGIGASSRPMADEPRKPREKRGLNWRILPPKASHGVRYTLFDANFWKTWVATRLVTPPPESGSLQIHAGTERQHQVLVDHWTAEQPITVSGRGRTLDEWRIRRVGMDNHWWDCQVMSAVAASQLGVQVSLATTEGREPDQGVRRKRRTFKMSELR